MDHFEANNNFPFYVHFKVSSEYGGSGKNEMFNDILDEWKDAWHAHSNDQNPRIELNFKVEAPPCSEQVV